MEIRQATEEDFSQIIDLIWIVLEDMELDILNHVEVNRIKEWLYQAMKDPNYRYGINNMIVVANNDQILGVISNYHSKLENQIDNAFNNIADINGKKYRLFVDLETVGEEWYLDTIVVHSNYRGRGIARKLIQAAINKSFQNNCILVGLNVDKNNPKAKKLYEKLGFSTVTEVKLSNHLYEHMQYEIS